MRSDPRKRTSRVVGRTQAAETTFTVLLDPGHGGDDPGAVWQFPDNSMLFEKDVNLQVARMMIDRLAPHIDVRMTRFDDRFINLRERAVVPYHYDLLISIHCNAIDKPRQDMVQGTEVYVCSSADKVSTQIAKDLAPIVADALGITPNLPNPVRYRNLRVLSLAAQIFDRHGRSRSCLCLAPGSTPEHPIGMRSQGTPAVLIELGYITSERDRAALMAREAQQNAAVAIAEYVNALAPPPATLIPVVVEGDDAEEDAEVLERKAGGKKRGRRKNKGIDLDAILEEV
jgi:N-acetylmuramoyl-L-alanine amidase